MTDVLTDTRVMEAEAEQYNASLVRRVDESESLAYFWVRFDGEPTPFEPGQYMTIGVVVEGKMVQRPYSVASPPDSRADGRAQRAAADCPSRRHRAVRPA